MSNGGFGLSGREGLALPGRLEFKDKKNRGKRGKGKKRGRSGKRIVKIQKGKKHLHQNNRGSATKIKSNSTEIT